MTTNQYWFFPLWTYLHDFGNWLEFGFIIPPFRFLVIILYILNWLFFILVFIVCIVLMVKAYQGQKYKLPWLGNSAEKWAS